MNMINNTKQTLVVCHHLLLVYDASKLSAVCVVKLQVVGLLLAQNLVLTPSVLVLYGFQRFTRTFFLPKGQNNFITNTNYISNLTFFPKIIHLRGRP